jgi:hypothetical protein
MNDNHCEHLCAWLRANGLDPAVIPDDTTIDVTPETITVDTFGLTPDGDIWTDHLGRPYRLRRSVRHAVPREQFW